MSSNISNKETKRQNTNTESYKEKWAKLVIVISGRYTSFYPLKFSLKSYCGDIF
jgi:hypothetical protein